MSIQPDKPLLTDSASDAAREFEGTLLRKPSLFEKLEVFDPTSHGAELMPDIPQGKEFDAVRGTPP